MCKVGQKRIAMPKKKRQQEIHFSAETEVFSFNASQSIHVTIYQLYHKQPIVTLYYASKGGAGPHLLRVSISYLLIIEWGHKK